MSFKLEGSYAPEKNVSLQMTYIQDYRDRMALRAEIAALQKELDELNGKTSGPDDPGRVIEGQCIPEDPKNNEAPVTLPEAKRSPNDQDRES